MKKYNNLETSGELDKISPLSYYPRPTLIRETLDNTYLNLNGIWNYEIANENSFNNTDEYAFNKEILVPYPIESNLSMVHRRLETNELLIYRKSFKFNPKFEKTLLHFGAVDNSCDVYLNGTLLGSHIGGYLAFSFDISDYLEEINVLEVIVSDKLDKTYPYGKQRKDNGGIFYTPVSGIWKTVWIESVPKDRIEKVNYETDITNKILKLDFVETCELEKDIEIYLNNSLVKTVHTNDSKIDIDFNEISLWSPDSPILYDLKIKTKYEEIKSYFAFRKIELKDNKFYLNDKKLFMHGLLDQGFYPDGIYTPKSEDVVINDLKTIKELGFNTLRKHIKVEDENWYYLCDTLGIIVWQDFVNSNSYSFFMDTALPTIGLKKGIRKHFSKESKDFFIKHSIDTINELKNHPSIVLWTIFNEGWGQFDTDKVYDLIKEHDNTRLYDVNSGWFNDSKKTDFDSRHIYFKPIVINKKVEKTLIISEFGGYSLKIDNHIYSKKSFGYKGFRNLDEYNKGFYNLYKTDIIGNLNMGIAASIYTQLSDVEEEINGIMTYDRKVVKLDRKIAQEIANELYDRFENEI